MDFDNQTDCPAGWTMGFDQEGREILIVIVKATYVLGVGPTEAEPADEHMPLVESDVFSGEPGLSSPLFESDFAHFKPRCDVLVIGRAHAQGGIPADRVSVSLNVGPIDKRFDVTGRRVWLPGPLAPVVSDPEPFVSASVTYDRAFGGVDDSLSDGETQMTYEANPVGMGYRPNLQGIHDTELARTEVASDPIRDPKGRYRPMSFCPIGRNWPPRSKYAGTYDDEWIKHRSPFWPDDFDYRYFQSAPKDQQMEYPRGGERLLLQGMSAQSIEELTIPSRHMPVIMIPYQGEDIVLQAVVDTIVIEPEKRQFTMTWRTHQTMKKSCFDIRKVVVGMSAEERRREVRSGQPKRKYENLNEMIKQTKKKEPGR